MATLDELQAQLAALTQRVNEITVPPDDYYTHRFSGEEIDNAVGRVADTPGSGAITAGDVGAAPEGFGLGYIVGGEIPDNDFNMATKNGWYSCNGNEINGPPDIGGAVYTSGAILIVANSGGGRVKEQILHLGTAGLQGFIQRRYYNNAFASWQPWEWVNPAMRRGVEYRTIERYNGKPVYIAAISLGAGPEANTVKTVAHNINNMQDIVDYGGSMNSNGSQPVSLPGLTPSGTDIRELGVNYTAFIWKAGTSAITNYTGTAWVKYTKTTD